jgi:hypothetical protein
VSIYRRRKLPVETLVVENPLEIRGINSRTELAEVGRLVRQKERRTDGRWRHLVDSGDDLSTRAPRSAATRSSIPAW